MTSSVQRQRRKSWAWKQMRSMTVGMTASSFNSMVVGKAEDGKPIYSLICKDRWGASIGKEAFDYICRIRRRWQVRIIVKCEAPDGHLYFEETELEADDIKLDEFTEVFKEQKQATIDACNPQHIYDVGWIAKAIT